jgi:site-specific DNA-methyltransferase (adenine-specific)
LKLNVLYQGDCLEIMPDIPDKSVDAIITDLPYGVTSCKWDSVIPFEPLWTQYKRIIKDNGAIVLTASQPFTSALVMSNIKMFKYEWIWEKSRPTGFFTAKKMPMKIHENILVFYKNQPTYNPEKIMADENKIDRRKTLNPTYNPYIGVNKERVTDSGMRYPLTIQTFNSVSEKGQHPTQKPVALFEYLIKTYTNEGDIVLDNCAGSGTTAIACLNTNRNYILIEKEPKYCEIIKKRILERSNPFI